MKKVFLILFGIILIGGIIVGFYFFGFNLSSNKGLDDYDKDIVILNQTDPVKIIIYGEQIPFRESLNVEYIHNLDNIPNDSNKNKEILVVSDLDDTLTLTNQDIQTIKNKIDSDLNFDFYYLGRQYIQNFIDDGVFFGGISSSDYGVGNVNIENTRSIFTGIWATSDINQTGDNRETLAYLLVRQFVRVLKDNS